MLIRRLAELNDMGITRMRSLVAHLVNLARIVMNHRKVKLVRFQIEVDKEPIGPVEKEMVGTGGIESDLIFLRAPYLNVLQYQEVIHIC